MSEAHQRLKYILIHWWIMNTIYNCTLLIIFLILWSKLESKYLFFQNLPNISHYKQSIPILPG